ncbi:MAG: ATP-binding protein [Candidatus Wallbacteria bacterium]|nr:ATP-binding protein [Candidatus Wallbacteria bacterium]
MLTAFKLQNFKSYNQEVRLPLGPLTVLIGANASGKSNIIEGLHFLSWLAQGHKLTSLQYNGNSQERIFRGRFDELGYQKNGWFAFRCETNGHEWNKFEMALENRSDGLHIAVEHITADGVTVDLYGIKQPSQGTGTDVGVEYNNFSRGRNKPVTTCSDQMAVFNQLDSPSCFDKDHKKSQEVIPKTVKEYQRILSDIIFLDPNPAKMREYSHPTDRRLLGDGTNLSSVLYALWGNEDQQNQTTLDFIQSQECAIVNRNTILDFIRSLPEQDIESLSFLTGPKKEVMVQLTETFGGEKKIFDATLLSDGTLRVLAITAALLSAPEGSMVVIEEIDNGVHPSRAGHLMQQIQAVAEKRSLRVLLSTHNPALLDALPDSAVPDVVFCYRDPKDGASRLVRLRDVPHYPELICQGSLGHLMTEGILERFVKFQPNDEERKKQAEMWLQNMHSGGKHE